MIVIFRQGSNQQDIHAVRQRVEKLGFLFVQAVEAEKPILCFNAISTSDDYSVAEQIKAFQCVEEVHVAGKPFRLVAHTEERQTSIVRLGNVEIGGREIVLMAGPCTVESEEQVMATAKAVAAAGGKVLRGGAYKPSTSPYSFQGMGVAGLEILREAGCRYGLKIVSEVMDPRKVELVAEYADMLQIGTRNMQNYDLLKEVGRTQVPILLKRGMGAKLEEWLLAAEYIAAAGNPSIVLCERGIRSFDTYSRNTLDLSVVPAAKALSHLPIIVDPSQGTGRRDLVPQMSLAAIAAGADGLLIEVHPSPDLAMKDGAQSMSIDEFRELVPRVQKVAEAVGRYFVVCHNVPPQ